VTGAGNGGKEMGAGNGARVGEVVTGSGNGGKLRGIEFGVSVGIAVGVLVGSLVCNTVGTAVVPGTKVGCCVG